MTDLLNGKTLDEYTTQKLQSTLHALEEEYDYTRERGPDDIAHILFHNFSSLKLNGTASHSFSSRWIQQVDRSYGLRVKSIKEFLFKTKDIRGAINNIIGWITTQMRKSGMALLLAGTKSHQFAIAFHHRVDGESVNPLCCTIIDSAAQSGYHQYKSPVWKCVEFDETIRSDSTPMQEIVVWCAIHAYNKDNWWKENTDTQCKSVFQEYNLPATKYPLCISSDMIDGLLDICDRFTPLEDYSLAYRFVNAYNTLKPDETMYAFLHHQLDRKFEYDIDGRKCMWTSGQEGGSCQWWSNVWLRLWGMILTYAARGSSEKMANTIVTSLIDLHIVTFAEFLHILRSWDTMRTFRAQDEVPQQLLMLGNLALERGWFANLPPGVTTLWTTYTNFIDRRNAFLATARLPPCPERDFRRAIRRGATSSLDHAPRKEISSIRCRLYPDGHRLGYGECLRELVRGARAKDRAMMGKLVPFLDAIDAAQNYSHTAAYVNLCDISLLLVYWIQCYHADKFDNNLEKWWATKDNAMAKDNAKWFLPQYMSDVRLLPLKHKELERCVQYIMGFNLEQEQLKTTWHIKHVMLEPLNLGDRGKYLKDICRYLRGSTDLSIQSSQQIQLTIQGYMVQAIEFQHSLSQPPLSPQTAMLQALHSTAPQSSAFSNVRLLAIAKHMQLTNINLWQMIVALYDHRDVWVPEMAMQARVDSYLSLLRTLIAGRRKSVRVVSHHNVDWNHIKAVFVRDIRSARTFRDASSAARRLMIRTLPHSAIDVPLFAAPYYDSETHALRIGDRNYVSIHHSSDRKVLHAYVEHLLAALCIRLTDCIFGVRAMPLGNRWGGHRHCEHIDDDSARHTGSDCGGVYCAPHSTHWPAMD